MSEGIRKRQLIDYFFEKLESFVKRVKITGSKNLLEKWEFYIEVEKE